MRPRVRVAFWSGHDYCSDIFCANFKKEQDLEGEVSDLDASVLAGESFACGIGGLATNCIAQGIRRRKR